ncbi:MAG: ABC transporter ATP-binding protein [Bacillota bacterium]
MVISMKQVSWRRENKEILRNINWEVETGENWAILGLNGSGKTTLLNILNGYIYPSSGEVKVLGKKFGSYSLQELRKSIGWVSSSLQENLYVNETVLEITLSGKFATIGLVDTPEEDDINKARELLIKLGCSQLVERPYKTLSQGEKQKTVIARALMSSPKILILDEPCTGLDILAKEHLLSTIQKLSTEKDAPTLIYVTHRVEEILPVFNNVLMLRKGEVYQTGQTKKVLTSANLSDFFAAPVEISWEYERASLRLNNCGQMGIAL